MYIKMQLIPRYVKKNYDLRSSSCFQGENQGSKNVPLKKPKNRFLTISKYFSAFKSTKTQPLEPKFYVEFIFSAFFEKFFGLSLQKLQKLRFLLIRKSLIFSIQTAISPAFSTCTKKFIYPLKADSSGYTLVPNMLLYRPGPLGF